MKKLFISLLLTCLASNLSAQTHELGFFTGATNYIGDIGSTAYINPNKFGGGLVYKYNWNPRIALRGNVSYLPIQGDDLTSNSSFRQSRNNNDGFQFSNRTFEFAAGIEFNFFNYNIREKETSFTPYILAQAAALNYRIVSDYSIDNSVYASETTHAIPVGVGIKGKLSGRFAFALESAIRFTFVDDLDFTDNEVFNGNYADSGYGNDYYVFTGLSLVYTFGRPPCYAERD